VTSPSLRTMERCPNSGKRANVLATNTRRINVEPYEAICPVCEQTVTVRISHEGPMDGRVERWSEHHVAGVAHGGDREP
jgi:hypothetical protein